MDGIPIGGYSIENDMIGERNRDHSKRGATGFMG